MIINLPTQVNPYRQGVCVQADTIKTDETARITAAGGFVEFGRVNGELPII